MVRNIHLLTVVMIVFSCSLSAQDIHYSQFFSSPLNINPALAGAYNGDLRVTGNYRNQWSAVPVDYTTYTGSVDFKIGDDCGKSSFLSAGLLFDYDRAGYLNLKLAKIGLNLAYTLKLGNRHSITPGILGEYNQRGYDVSAIRSGNQWNGIGFDPGIGAETPNVDQISFFDVGAGLNYRWQKSYRTSLDVGGALYHLLAPNQSFYKDSGGIADLERRLSAHVLGSFKLLSRLDLLLNGHYQKQGEYKEIVVNGQAKIYLNKNKERNIALHLGLGLRLDDAWYPMIAISWKNIHVGLSYDFNFSKFDIATDGKGGPELSFSYRSVCVPSGPFKPCPIY